VEALFDKAFENVVRLRIMSVLMVNEHYDFNAFKELLEVTDGNLASHLKSLESSNYIQVNKSFLGRKTHTTYKTTNAGRKAFEAHLNYLENLIRYNNQ
jgi:DNA-binding MarR family transcriptional regulator